MLSVVIVVNVVINVIIVIGEMRRRGFFFAWNFCSAIAAMLALLLLLVPASSASSFFSAKSRSLLPVTCYRQGDYDVLTSSGTAGTDSIPFCAHSTASGNDGGSATKNALCRVQWQVQFDWMPQRVTSFTLRFLGSDEDPATAGQADEESAANRNTNADRCLDSFGTPLSTTAKCQVISFGGQDASQNILTFHVDAVYHGGTTAMLMWQYRGADVSCETLATDPMALDALLVTRQLSVTVGPLNTLLTLVEAAPTPLSALQLDCPLPTMPCACRVGCAYTRAFWLDNPKSAVWQRPAIATAAPICGLSLAEWLSGHSTTRQFPLHVRDALAELAVARMNLANYGCAAPLHEDVRAYEAYMHINTRFTRETSTIDAICHDSPPDEQLPAYTSVLQQWNGGQLYDANTNPISPCACVAYECAARFGLYSDNLQPIGAAGNKTNGNRTKEVPGIPFEHPRHWDGLKLIFFIVACALTVILVAMVCSALMRCVCMIGRGAGPSGFFYSSANRYMFSHIGGGIDEQQQPLATVVSARQHADNIVIGSAIDRSL